MHKQKTLEKTQRRNCFILPFYKIYRSKTCKRVHLVPPAFWQEPRAGLGPIANINHQHLLLFLVALCECVTVLTFSLQWASAHIQPYTRWLDGAWFLIQLNSTATPVKRLENYGPYFCGCATTRASSVQTAWYFLELEFPLVHLCSILVNGQHTVHSRVRNGHLLFISEW